jgi:hypothetical protein
MNFDCCPCAGRLSPSILSGRITESIGTERKIRTMNRTATRPNGGAIVVGRVMNARSIWRLLHCASSFPAIGYK